MYKIKNNKLEVEISDKAAEVHSLKKIGDEYNYVWSGDPEYWAGRNPILFPQVSHNDDKTILIDGVKYPIGNHGFARNSIFELVDQKEDELTLVLRENEETLKCYPFKFELKVNYKLVDNRLNITYTIKNCDTKDMPYGFGLHPAFSAAHNLDNTKVVFNKEEKDGTELTINHELFEKYPTYVIENPNATLVTLNTNNHSISVEYLDFNIFAIWSKGDFVCLEPWINKTPDDPEIELKDRPGNIELKPGEEKTHTYSWIVND